MSINMRRLSKKRLRLVTPLSGWTLNPLANSNQKKDCRPGHSGH